MVERVEETEAAKQALLKAGVPVKGVRHGRGTARGWLYIWLGDPWHEISTQSGRCVDFCVGCEKRRDLERMAIQIAQEVTGRNGDNDGQIMVSFR